MATNDQHNGSTVLIDEYFAAGDERFLGEVLGCGSTKKLMSLADRWYADARPFARRALLGYVADGCDRVRHRPLVKRLFKLAEAAGDDEAMVGFLVSFDRLMRRRIVQRMRYDWNNNRVQRWPALMVDESIPCSGLAANAASRFSRRTRMYLVRRAFRYFRLLGHSDPVRFRAAALSALVRYADGDLSTPERLMDSWSLMHLLYWGSPAIKRLGTGIRVAPGRALSDLEPAPIYPKVWENCFEDILDLMLGAESRTVRVWASTMLRRSYTEDLSRLDAATLGRLLGSPRDEARALGVEAFRQSSRLGEFSLDEWLGLLKIQNLDAVAAVCDLARTKISAESLSLAELVELAVAPYAPVAELGFEWLCDRPVADRDDLEAVLGLRRARVASVRAQAADFLDDVLSKSPFAAVDDLRDLVDAPFGEFRALGLALFDRDDRFRASVAIAQALAESPYDDTRRALIDRMGAWEREFDPSTLHHLWAAAMLSVHRGGRVKLVVLDQLSDRMANHPTEAHALLPILAVALRSVRPGERRAALASVVRAALRAPELAEPIARAIPELRVLASREVRV